jgi:hypothetical protein
MKLDNKGLSNYAHILGALAWSQYEDKSKEDLAAYVARDVMYAIYKYIAEEIDEGHFKSLDELREELQKRSILCLGIAVSGITKDMMKRSYPNES